MQRKSESYDVVVAGGGLAGVCAAIASARHGAKTCLIQDRPVLGGNSSSEIRVTPHGAAAFHAYARETGIISELLIEERAINHEPILENGWTNSVWDMVMYDLAMRTPNLTLHVNTAVIAVEMTTGPLTPPDPTPTFGYILRPTAHTACPGRIQSVTCLVANAELQLVIAAKLFIDCTGDAIVGDLAGCEWRMGSEGRAEFNEPHAPKEPSRDTMGNSIHFKAKDMGKPVPFVAPDWAVKHDDPDFFWKQGRHIYSIIGGFWWLEIGVPWDTIHQAEDIRHELTRHTLGVWDWIKNKDPKTIEKAKNYALDFIGQVPGKRESRRILGRYFMTEHDIQNRTRFPDEIAFGGWFVDLHTPGGLLAPTSEPAAAENYSHDSEYGAMSYCGPYGIPFRALVAKDVDNLMMAGRNISVTHAALGTVRVMATTALMGQAAGTAAALALHHNQSLATFIGNPDSASPSITELQQTLLRDGCFLPTVQNGDPKDLARQAHVRASSDAPLSGVGPRSKMVDGAMRWWPDEEHNMDQVDALKQQRSQWIAVETGPNSHVDELSVCLSNLSDLPQQVEAWIRVPDGLWDYRVEAGEPLLRTTLAVPVGRERWISWHTGLKSLKAPKTGENGRNIAFIRLDLGKNDQIVWHTSRAVEPGCVAAMAISPRKMRRLHSGISLSFTIDPPQRVYTPVNILTGVTRPAMGPNLWRSDPAQPLPQWLELSWQKPQQIAVIELTFPGHLLREYHVYAPFYRDPQCPSNYLIDAQIGGHWQQIAHIQNNYQRHQRHTLPTAITTDKIRILVQATHGDARAAIYEVRCYEK